MSKQTLFISYCWRDGSIYADELETQLKDEFDVKRDKSQLITNDDIYQFMAEIANCDNVILVLTPEYVNSLNCMLEMSYLVSQDDWAAKAMVLVIDDTLYLVERKLEIINYWLLRQKRSFDELNTAAVGKTIWEEEKEYVDLICEQIEPFFRGLSRRKNPSQIAIVNEVIKKSRRSKKYEQELIEKGEQAVLKFLEESGQLTMKELADKMNRTQASTNRLISNLLSEGIIERSGNSKTGYFAYKKCD